MKSISDDAFSLIELLIAAAILSTAAIFIFRSFSTALSAVRLSQNITLAGYLAEGKLWEIEQAYLSGKTLPSPQADRLENINFKWAYAILDTDIHGLKKINFWLLWQDNSGKAKAYRMDFSTYLLAKNEE